MKALDHAVGESTWASRPMALPPVVWSETDSLTDVILCAPTHLAQIPCCAATRRSLQAGATVSLSRAKEQHDALVEALIRHGVRCHMLGADARLPDLCFTRDIAVATPFGLVACRPAMAHRMQETDLFVAACDRWGLSVDRIDRGNIEGGDICIVRPGLLIIGMSGERTSSTGLEAFSRPFREAGWEVLPAPFAPEHLRLDTIFCMLDERRAIACPDLLDPQFLVAAAERQIEIVPVDPAVASGLACNIVALGHGNILASSSCPELTARLRAHGYRVSKLDISQFALCGGGLHCLTLPLRRSPSGIAVH